MWMSKANENGVVFVTGETNKYLVTYEIEGEICDPVIETAIEIFNKMSFDDCYDIRILDLRLLKKPENRSDVYYPACKFYGTYHNPNDNLRMEIRKMFIDTDVVYDVGYAPDH